MSDVQTTPSKQPDQAAPTKDPTLTPRRLLVAFLSLGLGVLITAFVITNVLKADLFATEPISNWEIPVLVLAAIPVSLLVLLWLDYFMGTKLLPD